MHTLGGYVPRHVCVCWGSIWVCERLQALDPNDADFKEDGDCSFTGWPVKGFSPAFLGALIGSLSSQHARQRAEAGATFAQLMPLLPLEPGAAEPEGMDEGLRARKARAKARRDPRLGWGHLVFGPGRGRISGAERHSSARP